MTGLMAGLGVREGLAAAAVRTPFAIGKAARAALAAKWELLLPAVVLGSIFSGLATPVESAALVTGYVLVVQVFVSKDISNPRGICCGCRPSASRSSAVSS